MGDVINCAACCCSSSGTSNFSCFACGGRVSWYALPPWLTAALMPGVYAVLLGTLVVSDEISTLGRILTPMLIEAWQPAPPGMPSSKKEDWYGLGTFGGCRRKGVLEEGGVDVDAMCTQYGGYGTGTFADIRPFEQ